MPRFSVAFGRARRGRLFRTGLTWPNWPLRTDPVGQQNCPLLSTVPSYSPAQGYGQVNESDMKMKVACNRAEKRANKENPI